MNIIKKWDSLSDGKKSAVAFMAASYIHYAFSFLITPIFSRLLTTAEFGLVTTFNSWVSIMGPIATLTMFSGFFNIGMLDFENSKDQFESALVGLAWLSTFISVSVFAIVQVIFPHIIDMPLFLTGLMAFYFFTYPSTRYWQARERFEYKYKKLFVCTLAMTVLTPVFGLLVVFLGIHGIGILNLGIARLVGSYFVSIVFGIGFCSVILKNGKTLFNYRVWNTALKFCIPLIPHYLAMHVLSASDKVMINSIIGASEAGIYGMAYTASMVITSAWTAIQGSLSPFVLKHLQKKDYRPISHVAILCISGFSILCFVICITAPEFIMFLGGEKYIKSISLIPPLIASVLFMEMYNLFSMVEFFHKKTTAIMFATICAAALNVFLNYFCIPLFGYKAAAYTTLVCYIMYCGFHYFNMRRIEPIKIYDMKVLISLSFIYLTACFICLLVYDYPLIRYGIAGAIVLVSWVYKQKIKDFRTYLSGSKQKDKTI